LLTGSFICREPLERRRAKGVGKASMGRRCVAGVVPWLISHLV
jgi:hypothetical protein